MKPESRIKNQEWVFKLNLVVTLSLFLILDSLICFAQTFPFIHYTTKDGLSNNTVFSMAEDSDGYMWFGTANGLNKFDGYSFQKFYKSDGMNGNSVSSLFVDSSKTLWLSNDEAGFCRINPILSSVNFEKIKIIGKAMSHSEKFLVLRDTIYSVKPYYALCIFDIKRKSYYPFDSIIGTSIKFTPFCLIYTSGHDLLIGSDIGLIKKVNSTYIRVKINGLSTPVYSLYENSDGMLYAGSIGKIFQIKNDKIIGEITTPANDLPVNRLLVDRFNQVWFNMIGNDDFFIFRPSMPGSSSDMGITISMKERIGLDKCLINSIILDTEDNVWVSIFGHGIYYFYNFFIENYSKPDGLKSGIITCINKSDQTHLFVGTYDGIFISHDAETNYNSGIIKEDKFSRLTFFPKSMEYIKYIKPGKDYIFIGGVKVSSDMFQGSLLKRFSLSHSSTPLGVYYMDSNTLEIAGDSLAIGMWDNQILFGHPEKDKIVTTSRIKLYPDLEELTYVRINKIFFDNSLKSGNNMWVATSNGLVISYSNGAKEFPSIFAGMPVSQIIKDRDGKIWVVSEDKLGYFFNGKWTFISHLGNYPLGHLFALAFDNDNRIWLSTSAGLIMADSLSPSGKAKSARLFNQNDGLPSNEISDLYFDKTKNVMWVGTTDGLSRLDLNLLDKEAHRKSDVKLMAATNNDSLLDSSSVTLPYSKSDLQLKYHLTSINGRNLFILQYNFDQRGWETMDAPELKFSAMRRGKHSVSVQAINRYGESGQASQLNFTVAPPFYGTWYFTSAVALLFIGAVWRIVKWRIDRTRTKAEELVALNKEINSLQHQMLAAQMNPHFIFNSLNSFQYFINSDQKEKANLYLVRLARLIRINLDHADHAFISVRMAGQRMQLYLELEQIRFEEKIDFSITIDPNIDLDRTEVPNFVAQPFVENAIWHGLQQVKDKKIKIICTRSGENLLLKIIDNGIGLKAAEKNKKPDHISKGIHIVRERLRLLSGLNGQADGLIEITENNISVAEDSSSKPTATEFATGTSVTITLLPQMYHVK